MNAVLGEIETSLWSQHTQKSSSSWVNVNQQVSEPRQQHNKLPVCTDEIQHCRNRKVSPHRSLMTRLQVETNRRYWDPLETSTDAI